MKAPMNRDERSVLIRQYADGPQVFREALARVPEDVFDWRPTAASWSVHEIIIHCADSEANAHMRLRYLLAEPEPVIIGYDQDRWANILEYQSLPVATALPVIEAVRANTVPLLERLTEAQWSRAGRHTESGPYSVERWLEVYAEHLHVHARQVARNVEDWHRLGGGN